MTILQTKDVILKWIKSAETYDQCDLLLECILTFIVERFEKQVPPHELEIVKTELMDALTDQKAAIIWANKPTEPELAPTLAAYLSSPTIPEGGTSMRDNNQNY